MTALAKPAAPKAPVAAGGPVAGIIPQDIEQAFRVAEALAKAGDMVPKGYQGEPMKIMAAIMRGAEVGLAPMQALSSIAVINGRPTIWGDALPALVQRAGHHVDVEIEGDGDSAVAVATLMRGDTGKRVVRRFSMADAKRAGLLGKAGPWSQYPHRMLMHRARSYAVRDGAADALMGLSLAEEVQDYGPDAARDVTPKPRKGGVAYGGELLPATLQDDEIIEATTDPVPADAEMPGDPAEYLTREPD